MDSVELTKVINKMGLKNKTPQLSAENIFLHIPEINRKISTH